MRVAEIYNTIQGEGLNAGIPMTFVRLQGCSVGCPWCDTKPTWDSAAGHDVSIEDIVARCDLPWVCLTGGEPAEQDCSGLLSALTAAGKRVSVETSGEGAGLNGPIDHVTLSPKVAVHPRCHSRVNPAILQRAAEVKFVIGKPADLRAAEEFVAGGGDDDLHVSPATSFSESLRYAVVCGLLLVQSVLALVGAIPQVSRVAVKYMATPTLGALPHIYSGHLGVILTPISHSRPDGQHWYDVGRMPVWCADNGCFSTTVPFDPEVYLQWLWAMRRHRDRCLFATAPDVVGDAAATWARSTDWLGAIRILGYRAALVAQDGIEFLEIPWERFDWLFIGGSTEWKLSVAVERLIDQAKQRGKRVHVGRVNSKRRFRRFASMGADTADGTFLKFGPDTNLPKLLSWTNEQYLEALCG